MPDPIDPKNPRPVTWTFMFELLCAQPVGAWKVRGVSAIEGEGGKASDYLPEWLLRGGE